MKRELAERAMVYIVGLRRENTSSKLKRILEVMILSE